MCVYSFSGVSFSLSAVGGSLTCQSFWVPVCVECMNVRLSVCMQHKINCKVKPPIPLGLDSIEVLCQSAHRFGESISGDFPKAKPSQMKHHFRT